MPKAFIFDWSGTLSDNFHCIYAAFQKIFWDLGRECPQPEEVKLRLTVPYMTFWNYYFPDLTKERQDPLYLKYIKEAGTPDLFPGVVDILRELKKQKCRLFVVSSDHAETLFREIALGGVGDLFEKVYPDAYQKEIFLKKMIGDHGLKVNETFYVGDTAGDIDAGKAAGMRTIAIAWGHQHKKVVEAAHPDYLFDTLEQIKAVL